MSQMEPYDYGQYPPEDDEDFDEMQMMRGGSQWQPGWRPPQRPPYGPSCGPRPGPGVGGWPFWGYWGFRLRSAWRDVKFLHKLITDIVNEMIDDGLIAPGPNAPPIGPGSGTGPGTGGGGGTTTGTKGVTDGSAAAPGIIGEVMTNLTTGTWNSTVGTAPTAILISPLTLTPGDWDVSYSAALAGQQDMEGATILLTQPAQSDTMQTTLVIGSTALTMDNVVLTSATTPFNVSAPTLLAFNLSVYAAGTAGAAKSGSYQFRIYARRAR